MLENYANMLLSMPVLASQTPPVPNLALQSTGPVSNHGQLSLITRLNCTRNACRTACVEGTFQLLMSEVLHIYSR